jgi:hypothetical protein
MDCSLEYPSISDYLSIFAHDANGHVMTLLATGNVPFFFSFAARKGHALAAKTCKQIN